MAIADLRPEQATDDRGGGQTAATGIMSWLTWLPRLVALHLAWSVMFLLGGVVIGIAPATVTLVTVLRGQNEFARATGSRALAAAVWARYRREVPGANCAAGPFVIIALAAGANVGLDRKSTRLNSSHVAISYAVFCLKKKKEYIRP